MFSGVPLLVFVFSGLNILYMNFTQYSLYDGFVDDPSIMKLFYAYIAWTLMAIALKKLVIDREDFGFKSVLVYGPLLGLVIYMAINVSIMGMEPDWDFNMVLADVLWGAGFFGMATLFALMFKKYL